MATLGLQAEQNALIRMILEVQDIDVLEKLKEVLAKKKTKNVKERLEPVMTKEEILQSIDRGCKELKLIREGRLKALTVEEVLDDL